MNTYLERVFAVGRFLSEVTQLLERVLSNGISNQARRIVSCVLGAELKQEQIEQ